MINKYSLEITTSTAMQEISPLHRLMKIFIESRFSANMDKNALNKIVDKYWLNSQTSHPPNFYHLDKTYKNYFALLLAYINDVDFSKETGKFVKRSDIDSPQYYVALANIIDIINQSNYHSRAGQRLSDLDGELESWKIDKSK